MSYSDLLKDPRWQRKRLEVMQRADFACEICGDRTTTLNVHHPKYKKGRKPWEYDESELQCLCQPCHQKEHAPKPAEEEPRPKVFSLVGGPYDGGSLESFYLMPLLWVFEKNGETFWADDSWMVVKANGEALASHFPGKGHPYANFFMWPKEQADEFQRLWSAAPFPALKGIYGWVAAGAPVPEGSVLTWNDPEMLILRLEDLGHTLRGHLGTDGEWDEGVLWQE